MRTDTATTVEKIWKDFGELYFDHISVMRSVDASSFCQKAKDWVNLFCSLGNKRTGYGEKNVTCYMHSMVFHVPEAMKRHSNVKQFTGQGVEKNNDNARRVLRRKSNNWDSPADIIRTEGHQWAL